jgi:hypothetical protein
MKSCHAFEEVVRTRALSEVNGFGMERGFYALALHAAKGRGCMV